ncbi:DUF1840 domain-containing protein [Aquabacterium sp.]|uniref:DUF1840 domain-containing protein n=1 Tax=Aquabacterium sp. TaxID=1872578 RepID=UPI001992D297|nr:DUF1840 domain-containing protein [Aquabacterium sp.]MBC7701837.1 DUF1840 domain-containing protein [Aquabacterium sp.]
MTFKFKSQATGDLLMLSAHAQALLKHIGKSADPKGILTPQEMPAALTALKSLPGDEPLDESAAAKKDDDDEPPDATAVDLRLRAWPLIQMIEAAQAAQQPIVWGV